MNPPSSRCIPPIQWKLVRVVQVRPEADVIVRMVTIRNSPDTTFRHPVTKLAPLPKVLDEDIKDSNKN